MSRRLAATACLVVGVLWHSLVPAATETCDFENGMCEGYSSDCSRGACFKVQRVDAIKFGPTLDHNPGRADGSCAYATGRGTANLQRSFQGPFCFTGWYHLCGTKRPFVTFHSSQQQAHRRVFHQVELPFLGSWRRVVYTETRSGPVTVTISAEAEGLSGSVSLALDDFNFQPGPCPSAPKDGSCDFDWGDACGYSVGNETGQWNLNRWIVTARARITTVDVTTGFGGGYALYLPRPKGKLLGVLSSPNLEGSAQSRCLSFFYYITTLAKEKVPHVLEVFTKAVLPEDDEATKGTKRGEFWLSAVWDERGRCLASWARGSGCRRAGGLPGAAAPIEDDCLASGPRGLDCRRKSVTFPEPQG